MLWCPCSQRGAVLAAAAVLAMVASCHGAVTAPSFREYMQAFGKHYTGAELTRRSALYADNVAKMQAMEGSVGARVALSVNQYSDWTVDELAARMMPARPAVDFPADRYAPAPANVDIPDAFDWTAHGAVTSVKDQVSATGDLRVWVFCACVVSLFW